MGSVYSGLACFVGVFLIYLVLDLVTAHFVKLMGWDLDEIRDGGLYFQSVKGLPLRPSQ